MSCTFESPEFVTQFNGAAPTFGFNPGSGDLLGFPCSWAYKGKVCGVNSGKSFTPVFKTGTSQYTCSLSVGASATSILCPSLAHSAIPTGTHTLSYINIHNECDPPVSTTFYVGKSPTPTTDTVYSTVSTTFTRQPPYASTVTETYYSSTSTYTYSFGSSAAFSTTSTYFANYCKPTSSSSPPGSSSSPPQQSSSSRSSTTPAQPPPTSKSTNPVPPPVTSTLSSVTAPAPSSSSVNCPGSDQQLVYSHGEVFQVQCGIDRSGGDLSTGSPVYNVDLQQCIDTCATTPGCVDFSLSGSACYLKGSVNPVEYNSNVNGAILVGSYDSTTTRITGQPSGASATVAPAPTASGVQCPGANATTFKGSCGSSYVIECYWDRQSADIPGNPHDAYTLDNCINLCDSTAGCVDVSWVPGSPGACYLKNAANQVNNNNNVWGARQLSPCPSQPKAAGSRKIKLARKRVVAARGVVYSGPDYTYAGNNFPRSTMTNYQTATFTSTPKPSGVTTSTSTCTTPFFRSTTITAFNTMTYTYQTTVTTCSTARPN